MSTNDKKKGSPSIADSEPLESGRGDLNSRPLAPQASALAKLRYGPMFDCNLDGSTAQQVQGDSIGQLAEESRRASVAKRSEAVDALGQCSKKVLQIALFQFADEMTAGHPTAFGARAEVDHTCQNVELATRLRFQQ